MTTGFYIIQNNKQYEEAVYVIIAFIYMITGHQ